jgi:hypothetical protein
MAKPEPHDPTAPPWYPVCPMLDWNVRSGRLGRSRWRLPALPRLGLGELIEGHLSDPRGGRSTEFPLADLLRQSVYTGWAGYEVSC